MTFSVAYCFIAMAPWHAVSSAKLVGVALQADYQLVPLQLMPKGMSEDKPDRLPYHQTLEDAYGAIAQYYDLPWVSFRNALWKLSAFRKHGRSWRSYIAEDGMHPVDTGMKVGVHSFLFYLFYFYLFYRCTSMSAVNIIFEVAGYYYDRSVY